MHNNCHINHPLFVCLFVCSFVCLSVCPSVCLPVCLSAFGSKIFDNWAWVTVLGLHQESACRLPGNVGEMTSKKGTWHIFNSCWCRHNRDSAGKHSYSELNGQSLAHLTDSPWDESKWSNQYFVLTNHCTTFLEDSASHCRQMFVFTAQAVFHHEIHESNAQSCIYSPTA